MAEGRVAADAEGRGNFAGIHVQDVVENLALGGRGVEAGVGADVARDRGAAPVLDPGERGQFRGAGRQGSDLTAGMMVRVAVEVVHVEVDLVLQDGVDLLKDVRSSPRGGRGRRRGRIQDIGRFVVPRRRRVLVGSGSVASEGVVAAQGRILRGREAIVTLLETKKRK